jgi:hypothetical protein
MTMSRTPDCGSLAVVEERGNRNTVVTGKTPPEPGSRPYGLPTISRKPTKSGGVPLVRSVILTTFQGVTRARPGCHPSQTEMLGDKCYVLPTRKSMYRKTLNLEGQ